MRVGGSSRRTIVTQAAGEPPRLNEGIAVSVGKPTPLLVTRG
jgi:hypothetical protein